MQTILGYGGVIGGELAPLLRVRGPVRLVSRSGRAGEPGDEVVAADLLDAAAVDGAVAGSRVVYLVAGIRYSAAVWEDEWPRIMGNVLEACGKHGARLVFFDNVYAYGLVKGVMTEETPYNPCSRKGEVRARIATTLLEAARSGEVEAMIVRAPDFYGPRAALSLTHATVFQRLAAGKVPQWAGNPRKLHSFVFTPDAARSAAVLGDRPEAYGQSWHTLTSSHEITGEDFARMACEAAGRPYGLQPAPRWLLRLMGIFVPVLRENDEMMYQFEEDYRFSSAKLEAFSGESPTPYREGIARTMEAARNG